MISSLPPNADESGWIKDFHIPAEKNVGKAEVGINLPAIGAHAFENFKAKIHREGMILPVL